MTDFVKTILITALVFGALAAFIGIMIAYYRGNGREDGVIKKKAIRNAIIGVSIVWMAIALVFVGFWLDRDGLLSRDYRDDVYLDVPDSEVTLVAKQWDWLSGSGVEFHYVVKERKVFRDKQAYLGEGNLDAANHPFETGEYKIVNNQDGTFTIQWKDGEKWEEVTYAFPS